MNAPGWILYVLAGAGAVGIAVPLVLSWLRQRAYDAQYRTPSRHVPIKVSVRGPDGAHVDLERFAICWGAAFDCIAHRGPWARAVLVTRLGPGTRVQVMPAETWKGANGGMVGGELVAGCIRVPPSLDSLAHELAHRAEQVLEHGESDGAHTTWPRRGLVAADESYRAWLKALG